jgi:hypothetical protein
MTPPLPSDKLLRVEGPELSESGMLIDANDLRLSLRRPEFEEPVDISWERIERISARIEPNRARSVPAVLAVVGAMIFGSCGTYLASWGQSAEENSLSLVTLTAVIGGLAGASMGWLWIVIFQRGKWQVIFELPPNAVPVKSLSLADRLAIAAPQAGITEARLQKRRRLETKIAWILLVLFVAGVCTWYNLVAG